MENIAFDVPMFSQEKTKHKNLDGFYFNFINIKYELKSSTIFTLYRT